MGILVCSSRKTKGTKLDQDLSIPTDQRQAHASSPYIFFRYFYWLDVNTFSKSILRHIMHIGSNSNDKHFMQIHPVIPETRHAHYIYDFVPITETIFLQEDY